MAAPRKHLVMIATCMVIAGCSAPDTGAGSNGGTTEPEPTTETAAVAPSDAGGGTASDGGGAATSGSDAGGASDGGPVATASSAPEEGSSEPEPEEPSTDGGGVIVEQGNYDLTLADARPNDAWQEASYRVPGSTEEVTAMATELSYCDEEELEFRFAVPSGTIEFTVAQDLDSESSSETLDLALVVDGATEDTSEIGFDESATLSADLTGASAVVLQVENSSCEDGGVNALITSAQVSS